MIFSSHDKINISNFHQNLNWSPGFSLKPYQLAVCQINLAAIGDGPNFSLRLHLASIFNVLPICQIICSHVESIIIQFKVLLLCLHLCNAEYRRRKKSDWKNVSRDWR